MDTFDMIYSLKCRFITLIMGDAMPVEENTTTKTIVDQIALNIRNYNLVNKRYNLDYHHFISSRSKGIKKENGLSNWLKTSEASKSIFRFLSNFNMNARASKLVEITTFHLNIQRILRNIDVDCLGCFDMSVSQLSIPCGNSTVANELKTLFNYCASPGKFSNSGGFVIGSKVAHCIFPHICPMIDAHHIGISLNRIHADDYFPPGNVWADYLGYFPNGKLNPSTQGAGRNSWKDDQFLCSIGFYARVYQQWQEHNGNPGIDAFLKLDMADHCPYIPRIIEKALW
jgi:hypothetical protein